MELKQMMYNSIRQISVVIAVFAFAKAGQAQASINETTAVVVDSTETEERFKVDGVAGVVGKNVILESDIDKAYLELRSEDVDVSDFDRCYMMNRIMERELFAHHAIIDSVVVMDQEVYQKIDRDIEFLIRRAGSEERLLSTYRKNTMDEIRQELFEVNKKQFYIQREEDKITSDIEITPEEIRKFFYDIPEDERPIFGTELEIAQLVIEPVIPESAKQYQIERLEGFLEEIKNGRSFSSVAVLESQDPGTARLGGKFTVKRDGFAVKEFKDIAFTLDEGEISEPFETIFGYHIMKVEKIRGDEVDVRHVLAIPENSKETVDRAEALMVKVRDSIIAGQLDFKDAVTKYSTDEEAKGSGGRLTNPETQDYVWEQTKLDPELFAQIQDVQVGEVTPMITDRDRFGRKVFRIMAIPTRVEEHKADYIKDYMRIRGLALRQKRIKKTVEWRKEKIKDTYIMLNNDYEGCTFENNWKKN